MKRWKKTNRNELLKHPVKENALHEVQHVVDAVNWYNDFSRQHRPTRKRTCQTFQVSAGSSCKNNELCWKAICKDASYPISLKLFSSSLLPLLYMHEKKGTLNILIVLLLLKTALE